MFKIPARVLIVAVLTPALAAAQPSADRDAKIRDAMSAAPASISAEATILDWPAEDGGEPVLLRQGTNGWTCFPDFPGSEGNDPQCLDETFLKWAQAYISRATPQTDRIGIGYMISHGGAHSSNADPFATGPTPDNDWGFDPPHLMIVVPDARALEGLPTTRRSGGPWVMWTGTPYAHIMVPVESTRH